MFGFLLNKLKLIKNLLTNPQNPNEDSEKPLTKSMVHNVKEIMEKVGNSPDIITREFALNLPSGTKVTLIYTDGLVDKTVVHNDILKPLMLDAEKRQPNDNWFLGPIIEYIRKKVLLVGDISSKMTVDELVDAILSGDTVLIVDGCKEALILSTRGWEKRSIEEPESEVIVKGPKIGFVETLRTNTSLLRRIIKDPNLTLDVIRIGNRTKTDVCIVYIKGIVQDRLVAEIKRRLKEINTDSLLAAGVIEQYIEDAPLSLFPTVTYTERPDVTASRILEGRAAILTDGTPVVNIVPALFVENFHSPDDYTFRPYYATMIRWFRYIAFILSVLSPSLYVALTTYHQEIIPTPLLISMAAATEGAPFPAIIEVLLMAFIFEVLREAGIRIPRPLGQAVSIVGALVIGQTIVTAGLVGAPVVILTAFTAIASFTVPKLIDAGAVLRVFLTLLAGYLGGYGVLAGLIATFIHLASLRSFGVSYLAPIAPFIISDQKDVAVRAPVWAMLTRPKSIGVKDPVRQSFELIPESLEKEE